MNRLVAGLAAAGLLTAGILSGSATGKPKPKSQYEAVLVFSNDNSEAPGCVAAAGKSFKIEHEEKGEALATEAASKKLYPTKAKAQAAVNAAKAVVNKKDATACLTHTPHSSYIVEKEE
jgi:hypothetical protein